MPVRLSIPAAGVTAPVVPVGVEPGGGLHLPAAPSTVGWWAGSGPVGAVAGSTVLAGHVDSAAAGVGALAALRAVDPGTSVQITDALGGRHDYRIVSRRTYPKQALPAAVFGTAGAPRLVLVTCGGPFDTATGSYRDNIVAYALPA